MYNLSWTQAQEAMREGKRVRNSNFTGEEFFYMENGQLWDEEGYPMAGWYRGYDWQDEGWMILDWVPQEVDIPTKVTGSGMPLDVDFGSLEERVAAVYASQVYDMETMDYFVGISPRSATNPREKQNYNFRITKGRGHNKFQKRKKK